KAKALDYDDQGRMVDIVPSTSYEDYNLLYIDQSKCIRCNACRDVCPVECISLQKVSLKSVGYRG
ncbi:MAG: 4Fe-4S binding protein, partial [Kiritimatiellae bacterium]|nr:4Fe-4S binding protein [Kiritimatiellia bacterium]